MIDDLRAGGNPGQGNPGQGNPGQGNPGQGNPGQGNPGQGNPGQGNPGHDKPGQSNPGQGNPGQGRPSPFGTFGPYILHQWASSLARLTWARAKGPALGRPPASPSLCLGLC